MKKFIKICGIVVLILLAYKFVLDLADKTLSGHDMIQKTEESLTKRLDKAEQALERLDEDVNYDIEEEMIFDRNFEITTGEVQESFSGEKVQQLDVEAGGCNFVLEESPDEYFHVAASNAGKFQCYLSGEILYIKHTVKTVIDSAEEPRIVVQVPSGYVFNKVDIELGAGVMTLGQMHAREMELEVGAGRIVTELLQADALAIVVGMGEAIVGNLQTGSLDAEVGMGNLQVSGSVSENAELECAMGNITLEIAGSETDYDYNIQCGMGTVNIGSTSYSGLTRDKSVQNGAGRRMEVECAMGNVDIMFLQST